MVPPPIRSWSSATSPCSERTSSRPRGVIAQSGALATYSTTKDAIAGIDKPALVLHGTADATVPFALGEELAATLPNTRLVALEGAGHSYFAAGGKVAHDEVVAFLDEVDLGAR